jgi:zinc-ribbon domain
MAYCARCGNQNPDGADFCFRCGAPLKAPIEGMQKQRDERCEEECAGGKRGSGIFGGVLVIVIGIAVLFWALNAGGMMMNDWVTDKTFVMLIGLIIAAALVVTGISILFRRQRHQ